MSYEIGQKVYVFPLQSSIPEIRTIATINTRFLTLDDGQKFSIRTGHLWGSSYYGSPYLVEYTEEREKQYLERFLFDQSISAVKQGLYLLEIAANRLGFPDFAAAQGAEEAFCTFYLALKDLGITNLPDIKIQEK